uniref:Uncharacterized protein n=1 Tax=Oryza glumipatula TaxID=40148 RepID=A0A0D9YCP5_9ORYZ
MRRPQPPPEAPSHRTAWQEFNHYDEPRPHCAVTSSKWDSRTAMVFTAFANCSHRVGKARQTLHSRIVFEYTMLLIKEICHKGDSYS